MGYTAIKDQLVQILHVAGVTRVYDDYPNVVPSSADLPAIIIGRQDPCLEAAPHTNDQMGYLWRFEVLLLFRSLGQETVEQWDSGIEPLFKRMIDAVASRLTLNQTAILARPGGTFHVGVVSYKNAQYWGFRWNLDVLELVTTTFNE